MTEQTVDFSALEKNGLFLICGETGAGKTTILDAICYALYGRSSGGLRGGLEVMRCALAGSDDDTLVEFIFESGGRRYKFIRTLKYRTGKNKKSKNLNDYHNCLELLEDREIPLVEKEQDRYVSKKAEELIGLTYDQFRQVIILPQGQFERLLVSPSEEKEAILVSLFHAQRWQQIAEELQRRVAEQDKALKEERASMEGKLRSYDCQTLSQLEEKTDAQRQTLEVLLLKTQEAELLLTNAQAEKEEALLQNQAFLELARQEKRLTQLRSKEPYFAAEAALLEDANRAEAIRPAYTAWQTGVSGALRAQQAVHAAEGSLAEKEQIQEKITAHRAALTRRSPEIAEARQRLLLLENAREAYGTLARREEAVLAARKQEMAARGESQRAQHNFDCQSENLKSAMDTQTQAMAHYQRIQEQYLLGIGATLARELKDGSPCPVCGSVTHPKPAQPGACHITEAQLDSALGAMNRAGTRVSAALAERAEAEQQKHAADQKLLEALRQLDAAEIACREAKAQRLAGIDTEAQRAAQQRSLQMQIAAYEEDSQRVQTELASAMGGTEAARMLLEAAKQERETAERTKQDLFLAWEQALERSALGSEQRYLSADLKTEEKQRRQSALHQYLAELEAVREDVEARQSRLEGKVQPDMDAAAQALAQAEKQHRSCVTAQTLAAKHLEDMVRDLSGLEQRLRAYEAARTRVDSDLLFARRLRGDNGVSLQRYVLGVMLTSVTTEANRLLSSVYGGRYRLFRTDEIAGRSRKSGLELEVYDSQTSQRRSVTTLSGGEKFLVALSLAIGLSTVVQAQGGGVRLEAMFVDEGFGSLDREAVADALEVLQGIRRGSGIVGIISHVEQLAEVIPTRLEITKGRRGSTCTLRD